MVRPDRLEVRFDGARHGDLIQRVLQVVQVEPECIEIASQASPTRRFPAGLPLADGPKVWRPVELAQTALGWGRSYISQLVTKQKTFRVEQVSASSTSSGSSPARSSASCTTLHRDLASVSFKLRRQAPIWHVRSFSRYKTCSMA